MKTMIPTILTWSALLGAAAFGQPFQQEAVLISGSNGKRVWIRDAANGSFAYSETQQGVEAREQQMPISRPDSIFLLKPDAFNTAVNQFESRDFEAARQQFANVRETYASLSEIPGNHSTLAAFYELESLRKMGNIAELKSSFEQFGSSLELPQDHMNRQIEIYNMWVAIADENWSSVAELARAQLESELPNYQFVQAQYGLGLALENQEQDQEALDAYHLAITADSGASQYEVSQAILNSLGIYMEDPAVREAIDSEEESHSQKVTEAGALARLFQVSLGGDQDLPSEYQPLAQHAKSGKTGE